jgi:integrase
MLTQRKVDRTTKPGRYRDGGDAKGLYLQISDGGAKSWILRYELHGRERMMGLGSASEFKLKQARERALAARRLLADKKDPLAAKREAEAAVRATEASKITFAEAAQRYFDQNEGSWTSAKHRDIFLSTLRAFAFPVIGEMDVSAIDVPAVLRCLEPHWNEKAVTLDRTRTRMEAVLDSCKARGERVGDNPAAWAVIGNVLPAPRKVAPIVHHKAMPYGDLPAFMGKLRAIDTVAARALEFLILTVARAGEVIGATWDEIDFDQRAWTIPAARMKARREHRVPLSPATVDLLQKLPREKGNPRLFIGQREGAGLSDMSMALVMERLGQRKVSTIHGMRSAFRDWAGETTAFSPDIAEAAIAHARGDKTVQAYARGSLFEKRRRLMDAWAKYCARSPAKGEPAKGTVVGIGRK